MKFTFVYQSADLGKLKQIERKQNEKNRPIGPARSPSLSRFSFTICIDINIRSDRFITIVTHATNMNTSLPFPADDDYIQAAPDSQLSSSQSNLLSTLLKEEDQYEYNQLLNIQLSNNIQQILHQVRFFLIKHLSFSSILRSYLHFFIFHLLLHGWPLSYSKN